MAEYFDHWYADMTVSPVKDEIQQRHLGLPPHLLSTSVLPWEGIAEAVTALAREGAMWAEAAALDPGEDPALISFRNEALRSPGVMERTRRVMAAATAP